MDHSNNRTNGLCLISSVYLMIKIIMHAENSLGFQMRQTDALMTDLLFRVLSRLSKTQTNSFPKLSIRHVLLLRSSAELPLREWKGFWLLNFLIYYQIYYLIYYDSP